MKLSVIVPVYNMAGEGKLNDCLDSLMAQTLDDYEVIAVNDASTDNSLEILREYERKYPGKLRVLTYGTNKRQGGAKNEGLRAARGEWIGFVDSDDWVAEDFYEKLLRKAGETGADVVGCDYVMVDYRRKELAGAEGFAAGTGETGLAAGTGEVGPAAGTGETGLAAGTERVGAGAERKPVPPGTVVQNNRAEQTGLLDVEKHRLLFLRPGSMVVKVYRAQVIRENGLRFPEGIFYEDNCAGPLWSLYFTHFERVEEPLYYYYQHAGSTVHHISEEKCRDRMKAAVLLYDECGNGDIGRDYKKELEYRFTEMYYINTLFSYLPGVEKPKLAFLKELREGMQTRFPEFQKNEYYQKDTGETEKKMIALQCRSDWLFLWYYRLKHWIWGLRK